MNLTIKKIDSENIIWFVYLIIIFSAFLSNEYEKEYILHQKNVSKKTYRSINTAIFIVSIAIYAYFLENNIIDLKNVKNDKQGLNQLLNLIASTLFIVGGAIYLYTSININDEEEIGLI